jgi:hypothetical protein
MLSIRTMALVLILRKLNKENGIKFNVGNVLVVVYNVGKRSIHENSGIPPTHIERLSTLRSYTKIELNEAFHWKVSTKSISNKGSI